MDKGRLVGQLGQLRPFTAIPSAVLATFAETIQPVILSGNDSYALIQYADNHYLLALRGLLVLQKSHPCRPRPFSTLLPIGGLWPLPETAEPEMTMAVLAVTNGLLGIVADAELQRLCRETAFLRLALINSIGLAWQRMTEDADYRTSSSLPARLAQILLELSQMQGQQVIVPYTHQQIAVLLNSYRETISTIIGQFRRLGWLETRKGSLRLLNVRALTNAAQDEDLVRKLRT